MKKLFAIILSLGLIIAPMPVAHAAEGGGYAKQILGMANGIVGSSIITKCKLASMQPSLLVYMAGSLVYVFAEIAGGKAQKDNMKSQSDSLNNLKENMSEGGDYQKGAIDAQINSERKTLEHIQKRRKWMMAVKAIYGTALGLAIFEVWRSLPTPVGMNIPDQAACAPNPASDKMLTKAVGVAYSALMGYSGGGMMGAAMNAAMPLMIKTLTKFIFKMEVGVSVADKSISMLTSAYGRIGFFVGATALVFIIDKGLANEEKKSKEKIANLEKVRSEFEKNSKPDNSIAEGEATAGSEGGAADLNDPTKKQYALKALPKGIELTKSCFSTNASGGTEYSEGGCKNPIKLSRPLFDAKFNLPILTAGANTATDLANAISSGDLARADIEAGNLASMAGRIDAVNKDLMKKINDQLKAKGQKPIDVNGEINRQITELNKGLNAAEPGSGNFTLADVSGDEASVSETPTGASNEITTAGTTASVALPTPSEDIDLSKIDEGGITEEGMIDPNAAGNVASLDDSLNNFESAESDISKDPEVSIFKQVSNRYFLNYTKIFQRKEINPPLAEPAPTP